MSELKTINQVQDSKQVMAKMIQSRMTYNMPTSVDVSRHSTFVVEVPQANRYTQTQEIIFDIHSLGTSFADFRRSWLSFDLTGVQSGVGDLTSESSFGRFGSAHNLIQEILITSRSGTEISRLRNANAYNNRKAWLTKPREYFQTVGPMSGFAPLTYEVKDASGNTHPEPALVLQTALIPSTGALRYVLPLADMCGFFDQDKLAPGLFTENMRIRFLLASPTIAFSQGYTTTVANPITKYVIDRPEIHWRVIMANDEYIRAVAIASSQEGGLTLEHRETYNDQTTSANSTVNYDIKKGAGNALSLMILPRLIADFKAQQDSMACAPYNFRSVQHHIGSDYFPQIALRSDTVNDISEFYINEMDAYGGLKHSIGTPNVPYGIGDYDYGGTGFSCATCTTDLLKTDSKWAGYWISNSRALVCQIINHVAVDTQYDSFLTYMRIVKVFPSQVLTYD